MTTETSPLRRLFTGNITCANYHPSEEPMYRHNCYIEALPPLLAPSRAAELMRREPVYNESERLLPPERRLMAVQRIASYIEPTSQFLELEQRIARVIRNGYLARNPLSAEWRKQILAGYPNLDTGKDIPGYEPIIRSTAAGFAILGVSGIGKSTTVESVLSLYPQVIEHTEYNGKPFYQQQLVWLKLDCPFDGSVRGLCLNFFQSVDQVLGTSYYQRYSNKRKTARELLPAIKSTAGEIGLGLLVVDEIQRINPSSSGGSDSMLNFFVELINTVSVPIILVGTYKAYDVLASEFANARRSAGHQGDFVWPAMGYDESWHYFVEGLWRYQWTRTPTALDEKFSEVLHYESQGITDIAIKLYMLAQWATIGEEDEILVPETFSMVAQESLQLARPILEALRTGNKELLLRIPDIKCPMADLNSYYDQANKRVMQNLLVSNSHNRRNNDISQQVMNLLISLGYDLFQAKSYAKLALEKCGRNADIKLLAATATQLATLEHSTQCVDTPKKQAVKKKKTMPENQNDMRRLVAEQQDAYSALQGAGLIKNSTEFAE